MLILTLSTASPFLPPAFAQEAEGSREAVHSWQLSTSLDACNSLSTRLVLESTQPLGSSPQQSLLAELLVLERESFPSGDGSAWTRDCLVGLSLEHPASGNRCVVGPLSSSGLLKRFDNPLGRSLAPLDQPSPARFQLDRGASATRKPALALQLGSPIQAPGTKPPARVHSSLFVDDERLALGLDLITQVCFGSLMLEGLRVRLKDQEEGELPWFPGAMATQRHEGIGVDGLSASLRGPGLSGRLAAAWSSGPWMAPGQYVQGLFRLAGAGGVLGLGADFCSDGWQDSGGTVHGLTWRMEAAGQSAVLRGQRITLQAQALAERGFQATILAKGRWERTSAETRGLKALSLLYEQELDSGCAGGARSEAKASLLAGGLSLDVAARADWDAGSFETGCATLWARYHFGLGPKGKGKRQSTISLEGMGRFDIDKEGSMAGSGRFAMGIEGQNAALHTFLSLASVGLEWGIRARLSGVFN